MDISATSPVFYSKSDIASASQFQLPEHLQWIKEMIHAADLAAEIVDQITIMMKHTTATQGEWLGMNVLSLVHTATVPTGATICTSRILVSR